MANESPCLMCTRTKDPENCENKTCRAWREWFIKRWEELRQTWQTKELLTKTTQKISIAPIASITRTAAVKDTAFR